MSESQSQADVGTPMNRRRFVQGLGATAAGAVALGHSHGPIGDAEAIPPLVIAGAAVAGAGALGGAAAFGWALREYEVIGSDSPPEGLTPEALKQRIYETARARESTNASTFIDNKNILDGVQHSAYVDGKIAAIEALNEQESQSDVQDAGIEVMNEYATTVKKNFLKGWNESVQELQNLISSAVEMDDDELHVDEIIHPIRLHTGSSDTLVANIGLDDFETEEYEMPDGSSIGVETIDDGNATYNPIEVNGTDFDPELSGWIIADAALGASEGDTLEEAYGEYDAVIYLVAKGWQDIWDEMEDVFDDVRDGLTLWVDNVYSSVQSGDLDVGELITPRERAAMMEEEEGMAQAIADLAALNVPVDVGREATIYLPHVDATIRGTIGATGATTIEAGESYDPDTIDGSIYLTYDASLGEGTWGAFEAGVDGGVAVFTAEPWEGVIFVIETIAGESVTVTREDFTAVDANGDPVEDWEDPDRWEVDLSDDLENAITEIESVEYFAESEETDLQTIRLSDPFEVTRIEDRESGEEVQQLEYSSSEPQSDDNYITQEEWDELQEQNEQLIQDYEDSLGGGGGFGSIPGAEDLASILGISVAGGGAVALGTGAAALYVLFGR